MASAACVLPGGLGAGDDAAVPVPSADAGGQPDASSEDAAHGSSDGSTEAVAEAAPFDAGEIGDGGPPLAELSTSAIDFGQVGCGGPQATQTLLVSNGGGSALSVSATVAGTAFSITPTSLSIPPGGSGTFTLGATIPASATAAAAVTGSMLLFTNDPAHTNVSLLLSATPTGATLTGSATYSFPSTEVGSAVTSQTVTLQNSGNASASFTVTPPSNASITLSGVPDGGIGFTLAPGATWTSVATYLPTSPASSGISATSAITATGTVCGASLTTLSFAGKTVAGTLTGWPNDNRIDFGPARCGGAPPPAQTIVLSNTSTAVPVHVTSVDTSAMAGFTTNAAAGSTIATGGSLTIAIDAPAVPSPSTANPSISLDPVTGTLVVHTDADTSPAGTSITLTEEPQGAVLSFGTSSTPGCVTTANFGDFGTPAVLLEPVPAQSFCVVNSGDAPADVSLAATVTSGDTPAAEANDAAADGAAGGPPPVFSVLVPEFTVAAASGAAAPGVEGDSLTFTPDQSGPTTALLSMTVDSATPLCQVLPAPQPLSGSAIGGGPVVTPAELTFDARCGASTAPVPQTFVVENTGTVDMNWAMTQPAGPGASLYTLTADPAPGLLHPDQSATVTVTAPPVASPAANPNPAALAAQVTVTTDVPYDPGHVVALDEVPIGDQLSFSVAGLKFGQVPISTATADNAVSETFAIGNNANPGSSDASLTLVIGGGAAAAAYTGPELLSGGYGAGGTAIERVTFAPTSPIAYPATLSISTADPLCTPLPPAMTLTGTGTAGAVSLSAATLTFGQLASDPKGLVDCGATGTTQTLTISNVGNQSFDVTQVTLGKGSSSPFRLSGIAPPSSLPIGGSAVLTLTPSIIPNTADPNDSTAFSDALTIATDAANDSPHAVALVMQPRGAVIADTPLETTWSFGTVGDGSIATFTSIIQNTGNAPALVTLQGLLQPAIFGLQDNPTTVPGGSATELVGQFTPPSPSGSWSDQGQLVVTAADAFCAPLPDQWITPGIVLSGASNAGAPVTVTGSLVFPTTDCGAGPPAGQSVTLTNATNRAYSYTVGFASGAWYDFLDSGSGMLAANGSSTIVVNPKTVDPGQGILAGSAPYADDLMVSVATSPAATSFTVPISWTLNGAVLSLPQGAGPYSDSEGTFYVADSTSGFPMTMDNAGTATASVSLAVQPPGAFTLDPPPPIGVLPGIPAPAELVSGSSAPACPVTTDGTAAFVYSGPVCQPFAQSSVAVRACSGTYTPPSGGAADAGAAPDGTGAPP